MAYSAFDKFDHETAMKYLKSLDKKTLEELEIDCYDNKRLLHKEIECKKYCVEHIVDLLENARRRGEEGKYDDAVARLYRLIEMMAQYRLWSKYNIDTSDVDLNRIPREHRERYGKIDDKPITLPLKRSYELLETLNDDLGKDFFANKKMKALLDIRNNSILAHGIRPVKKEQFESMLKVAEEFILKHFENLDFRKARFPRIKYEKIKTTCTQS
ncbi:MAG TPA: TIGR02710 family CRISPR-associated protein [Thermoplasmatales archaeon]|nr:TIGR02710 family CRISPR-associated protein [Thermoplasmatales archaeon]